MKNCETCAPRPSMWTKVFDEIHQGECLAARCEIDFFDDTHGNDEKEYYVSGKEVTNCEFYERR